MKRILFVIVDDFRDEEFEAPWRALETAGHRLTVASLAPGTIEGMLGMRVEATRSIEDIQAADFDLLLIPGGDGTPRLRASEAMLNLVRDFVAQGKLICAICWAPTILARAGVLAGRRATVCKIADPEAGPDMEAHQVLQAHDVHFVDAPLVQDGAFITANGPSAAEAFAQAVLAATSPTTRPT
jgi:protease I